jgi:hypothetical protein
MRLIDTMPLLYAAHPWPVSKLHQPPGSTTPTTVISSEACDAARPRLEACVAQAYARAYGARIHHFHDLLLAHVDADGQVLGAIGATAADTGRLFLESYLPSPIEQLLAAHVECVPEREQFAEVGNLAASRAGSARALMVHLAFYLLDRGRSWAVLTGTQRVRQMLARLGASLHDLGPALACDVNDGPSQWGTYYEHAPRVVAVDLEDLCDGLVRHAAPKGP